MRLPLFIKDFRERGVRDFLAPNWHIVGSRKTLYINLYQVGSYFEKEGKFICNTYRSVLDKKAYASYQEFDTEHEARQYVENTPDGYKS